MKMDTTTWILLLVLLFLLLRKQASAATATSPGLLRSGTTPGTNTKSSLLQQIFGKPGTTAPAKPSGGVSAGVGSGAGTSRPPSTATQTGWRPPARTPVNLLPSAPLNSLIPSVPPPVYNTPTMNYAGEGMMPTIPSDTSGIYVTPDDPMPTYGTTNNDIYDDQGNWIGNTGGMLQSEPEPVFSWGGQSYPGDSYSPTSPSDVGLQTIDTSTLGSINYLDGGDGAGDFFGWGGGSSAGVYQAPSDGGGDGSEYADMAMSD